jgi:8-oxo-dGTP pyrophosphatase MutT (NUDIX family)
MSETVEPRRRAVRPRDAATLVLYRREGGELRVLMGQRSSGHKFMPDRYVFPGGRIDRADYQVAPATPLHPRVEANLARSAGPAKARALALAAVRETFEETGLIIGRRTDAAPPRVPEAWRPFYQTGFAPALDGLEYFTRAVTPPFRPIRFNARFFMAPADEVAGELKGSGELLYLDWLPVGKAKELPLPNITKYVLEHLHRLVEERERRSVRLYRYLYGKHVLSDE